MTDSVKKNKITWVSLLKAIIQAAIAALTALGVTSCSTAIGCMTL
ncbi:smalltalk protein [Bacteroides oleiciplenus]|nr:smalltalk protein [Bacteroides oleiciplenus]